MILQRALFCEILKCNSHTQKLCLNLNRELQQLGWTEWAPEPPTTYQIASENECSNPSITPHQITAWNYTKCSLKSSVHWKIWHTWPPPDARQTRISAPRIHIPSHGIERGFALIQMHLPHVLLQPFFVDIPKTTLKTNYNTDMQNEFICKKSKKTQD